MRYDLTITHTHKDNTMNKRHIITNEKEAIALVNEINLTHANGVTLDWEYGVLMFKSHGQIHVVDIENDTDITVTRAEAVQLLLTAEDIRDIF
jgi:hypothetical protein